jgi:hypothetical protein
VFSGQNPRFWDANLGQSLARSLARGTAWISDATKLRRIEALGAGPNIKPDTEQAIRDWNGRPFSISSLMADPPIFRLAQYELHSVDALKTKLREFPSGTVFTFQDSQSLSSEQNDALYHELLEFGKGIGTTLVRTPKQQPQNSWRSDAQSICILRKQLIEKNGILLSN